MVEPLILAESAQKESAQKRTSDGPPGHGKGEHEPEEIGYSRARPVLPGTTYLVTRRCIDRRYFLRPDPETTATVAYCLAVASRRYGVLLHGFVIMSNHLHLSVTDVDGQLPAFMQWVAGMTARALNVRLGRRGTFWAPETTYSRVEALDPETAATQLLYVLANPVRAGLVERGSEWPGLWSDPARVEGPGEVVARPSYFLAHGDMPEEVTLSWVRIPGFEDLSLSEYREWLRERLRELEDRERGVRQGAVLGREAALGMDPFGAPKEAEDEPARPSPEVAGQTRERVEAAEERYAEFRREHAEARTTFRQGQRGVIFPAGTYKLRRELGVPTRAPPERAA